MSEHGFTDRCRHNIHPPAPPSINRSPPRVRLKVMTLTPNLSAHLLHDMNTFTHASLHSHLHTLSHAHTCKFPSSKYYKKTYNIIAIQTFWQITTHNTIPSQRNCHCCRVFFTWATWFRSSPFQPPPTVTRHTTVCYLHPPPGNSLFIH